MPAFLVTVSSTLDDAAPQALYLLDGELTDRDLRALTALLHDPVIQRAACQPLAALDAPPAGAIDVAFRPGVTDNEAESALLGARRLGVERLRTVKSLRRYAADDLLDTDARFNPLIQTSLTDDDPAARRAWYDGLLAAPAEVTPVIATVPLLEADDAELERISRVGILALDLAEMRALQTYFTGRERAPTDGELETIAQTWSEHCSHKTFKAKVRYRNAERRTQNAEPQSQGTSEPQNQGTSGLDPALYGALHQLEAGGEVTIDSMIKTFLMVATQEVLSRRGTTDDTFVISAFVDNAGILAFSESHEVSFKVETHNHPSALEPFGGANTGVGGVVRDVLGVSAKPIANTDVLCFGPLDTPPASVLPGVLHPQRVAAGVVAGVRDYGNKLGIPTVNGAVLYDPGYIANPLVYCGTVGLAPRGMHPRQAAPGDAVVVVGGKTGRDGIHGATFSSIELTHTTAQDVGAAVQIGDPITEKKVIDVILQARDERLYSAITDCGAGGLSSAVGEMGAETGVAVALDDVPLKYAGLQPWEIWLSEAQERMVIAVPQPTLARLLELCASEDVEATVIGQFTDDGRLSVTHRGATLVDLDMRFLHDGRPQRELVAVWRGDQGTHKPGDQGTREPGEQNRAIATNTLLDLLAHPNIASKAAIVRSYDHEVGGRTAIKPLVGAEMDGPGDAAVLRPLPDMQRGIAIGCGINPRYGAIDPYWMALACVDEALRNVVAVGGDPRQTAILDNFCWGDPRQPDRMAGLVRAAAGCYDAALAYGAPYISGKDSLNNEYRAADGSRTPIPPTLLISALAMVPDVRQAVSMDLKAAGNLLLLLGVTRDEFGGAHAPAPGGARGAVPHVDLASAPAILAALHGAIRAGAIASCHDLSEGGLGVAAAEMAIAGRLGLTIDLGAVPSEGSPDDYVTLFGESQTRLLLEVAPAHAEAVAAHLAGLPWAIVGSVTAEQRLVMRRGDAAAIDIAVDELAAAWQ